MKCKIIDDKIHKPFFGWEHYCKVHKVTFHTKRRKIKNKEDKQISFYLYWILKRNRNIQ